MTFSTRTLFVGCMAALTTSGAAIAQEACTTYTVVAGDNLRYIARAAYGDSDMFRVIYGANVNVIGEKADLIEVGVSLNIPCDPRKAGTAAAEPASTGLATGVVDPAKAPVAIVPELPVVSVGSTETAAAAPETAPAEAATTTETPVAEAPAPDVVATAEPAPAPTPDPSAPTAVAADPAAVQPPMAFPFRLVTGNGYAPFADEMLPGGGMFTQLVEMAIFRADPAIPYNLTFVNDWQAHLDALLPSGAYDISFPWIRPDCESTGMLPASDAARCEAFVFSAPLYEIVDGYFMKSDSDLLAATSYTAFEGKRICRPESFTTGVLEAAGLTSDKINLSRLTSATDCFEALAAGKVDIVSIDAEVGDSAIAAVQMTGDFAQNPHLVTFDSLHAIAHKSNARAVEMVGMLNGGVVEMYESGEWYEIVSSALERSTLQQN